jgi:hypothetical protein
MSWLAQSKNRFRCYLLDGRIKKGQVADLFKRSCTTCTFSSYLYFRMHQAQARKKPYRRAFSSVYWISLTIESL